MTFMSRVLLTSLALLVPFFALAAEPQPGAASPSQFADRIAAFREGLREEEFVQDRNVTFEFRWLEGQGYDRAGGSYAKMQN